jgi:iron complex outermembrane recepter protein
MNIFYARSAFLCPLVLFSPVLFAPLAIAQSTNPNERADIVVTGNPLGSGLFEMVSPTTELSGRTLDFRRASSLGETLSNELGVNSTYFGPNASRPVIRGLDGDRIKLLQNGNALVDASSLSFDHAVAVDPLIAERIEILRGPAALLYGGNAIGGVVNVLDNRIPTAAIDQPQGRGEFRIGSADRERSGAVVVEAGTRQFALHADAYQRDHRDVAIPGFSRSARQRALDDPNLEQPSGRLPNSFNQSEGGAIGGSMIWSQGYAGLSYSSLRSTYGTPAEDTVRIDLRKETIGFASEIRQVTPMLEAIKLQFSHSDYQHEEKEKDSGNINTTFKHRGYEGRLELRHAAIGGFRGVFGTQFNTLDFAALGAEAFVPSTRSQATAVFLFEEYRGNDWRVNFGARSEQNRVRSDGDDPTATTGRFGTSQSRNFSAQSASLGGLYSLNKAWALTANYAYTERAPTSYELFANGPHAATGTFEVGNPDFAKERSHAFDLALRHRSGANQWSIGVFQKRFSNYLLLAPTGRNRAADGSFEDPNTPGISTSGEAADAPEYQYQQVPALFRGVELGGRWRAIEQGGTLDFDAKLDTVRAIQSDTREALPRIPPVRLNIGALYQSGAWYLRAEVQRVSAQARVAANELPSDGYTLANAFVSYRLKSGASTWDIFLRANNLFNVEARNHVSLIKDIAPLPGRGLVFGVRASF